MTQVRVRIAPSPSGVGHIGLARTAIYNWLWARQHGGVFILRIEDTDQERSSAASIAGITDALRWLGLDWDEGPDLGGPAGLYTQMERLPIYQEYQERLLQSGHAYRCYCTKQELDAARARQLESGHPGFRYPGTCRDRTDTPALPFSVRFKVPVTGSTGWADLVKGRLEFLHSTLQDAVIMRANGVPLYNFGVVVDDITMGITLVARGEDHLINTPLQILLFRALGHEPPQFGHMPLILGQGGQKLSKREGASDVLAFRDQGYLPDGVLNYLARLGWSHGDQEIFTRQELIEKFNWNHVGITGAHYDAKKFLHVQATHLRSTDDVSLAKQLAPWLVARGLEVEPQDARLIASIGPAKLRCATLVELAEAVDFYFREPPQDDAKAVAKFLRPESAQLLLDLAAQVEAVTPFEAEPLEASAKLWLQAAGLELKQLAQPARVALTGRGQSPGLFEVMAILGREVSLARLRRAADRATAGS